MVVYVETVIIDNFCFDFLLGYLTYFITKQKPRYMPIVTSAIVGSIFALIFPLLRGLGLLIKIPMLLLCTALLTMKKGVRGYLINTFFYSVLSFLLSGSITFLLGGKMDGGFIDLKWGGVVGALSLGALLLIYSVRQIVGWMHEKKQKQRFVTAELINGGNRVKLSALYDSGNLLTDEKGEGVVVTDKKYLLALGKLSEHGEMRVNTASGSKVLKLVKIPEIRIYSDGGENILFNVTAALSDLPKEYALIVPCE